MGWMTGVQFPAGAEIFCHNYSHNDSGVQPASYPVGNGILSQGVKWLECEADHYPLTSAEVMKAWSYTFTPPYIFMVWCLSMYRIHFHGMVLN